MARITVDDCLKKIPNRFQLTLVAALRSRQLVNGAEPLIDTEGSRDKSSVIAPVSYTHLTLPTICSV